MAKQVGQDITGERTSEEGIWSVPVVGDILKWLYNPDLQSSKQNVLAKGEQVSKSYDEIIKTLEEQAKKYPKFRDLMIKQGYMNPDGTINAQKMMDKGYLQYLKNMQQENAIRATKSIDKQAGIQALKGQAGLSSTAIANLKRKALLDTAQQNAKQFAQAYKSERENAYNKALQLGNLMSNKAQQDYMQKANMILKSKMTNQAKQQALYNMALQYAKDQSKGLLQDPDKMMQVIGTVAKIAAMA